MVEYVEKQFGERALNGDKQEAVTLQAKIAELEAKLEKQKAMSASTADDTKKDINSEDETDEDVSFIRWIKSALSQSIMDIDNCFILQEDDDYMDDLPVAKSNVARGPRASVSAEAFGVWN